MERVEFTKFIKVKAYLSAREVKENEEREYIEVPVAINPIQVLSYHPAVITISGEQVEIVVITTGGSQFYVKGPYKDFDKFFDNIDIGMEIKEQ